MGYIRHNAIIVTTLDDWIAPIHERAVATFKNAPVSEVVQSPVNGYASFFVAPDGSKQGWQHQQDASAERDAFVQYLQECRSSGKGWPEWAEVVYGSDDSDAQLVRHAWSVDAGIKE